MAFFDKTIYECSLYRLDDTVEYHKNLTPEQNIKMAIQTGNYKVEISPIMVERISMLDYSKFKEILTGIKIPAYLTTSQKKNGASETTEFTYPNIPSFILVMDDRVNNNLTIEPASLEHLEEYKLNHQDIESYKRDLEVTIEAGMNRFFPEDEYKKQLKKLK